MAPSATSPTILASNGSAIPLSSNGTALSPSPSTSTSHTSYRGYDHVTWYVGNAKQAASYYITRFGFSHVAYKGLETGSRYIASHVVRNGGVTFVLTSPTMSVSALERRPNVSDEDRRLVEEIYAHLAEHGDAVKDVAFEVDDARAVWEHAVGKGAENVHEPRVLAATAGGKGKVVTATIKTYGDTTHTLVERHGYTGAFLPGYRATPTSATPDPVAELLPGIEFEAIDHCVGNQDWDQMQAVCE